MSTSRRLVAAVACGALAVGVADRLLPAQDPLVGAVAGAETRGLSAAAVVCPGRAKDAKHSTSTVTASDADGGTLTVQAPGARAATTARAGATSTAVSGTEKGAVLTATGAAAAGLVAETQSVYAGRASAGTAATACITPATSAYLVGPATTAGREATLVLINPDPTPANVDIAVASDGSPFAAERTRGIALAGFERYELPLLDVAPEREALAVRVQTGSGRVAAAIHDRWYDGSSPLGVDWLAPGARPGTDLVVPGIGGAGASVEVILAGTSDVEGTAVVRVVGPDGEFIPAGLEAVDIGANGVVRMPVPQAATGVAGALHITSDVPLLAAAVTARDAPARTASPDFAWSVASSPLDGAEATLFGTKDAKLVLTAVDRDVSVGLRAPGASVATRPVRVGGATSVVVSLAEFPRGVIVEPDAPGALYAARLTVPADSGAISGTVLRTPGRTVTVPPARRDVFLSAR